LTLAGVAAPPRRRVAAPPRRRAARPRRTAPRFRHTLNFAAPRSDRCQMTKSL